MTLLASSAVESAPARPWAQLGVAFAALLGGAWRRLGRRGGRDDGLAMAQNGGG